ncbi:hypothetical protein LCGC14_0478690 [marine sediment metagenome]|uniref:Metallopeptidase domain-containing protein n=1 Tax=marine sediment metagenome TaxID=412755 RepID=A0A0F9SA02_9ZZZZ
MFRLQDPKKLVDPLELERLRKKLDASMSGLIRLTVDGGNPFLYSLVATKTHELEDTLPGLPKWKTAATNGEKYFWHPEFLAKLTSVEIPTVLQHESIHVICEHVARFAGKDAKLWSYCIDFVANAHIENDFRKSHRYSKAKKRPVLWSGNIGRPMSIERFVRILDGQASWPKATSCFVDMLALHMSPEALYEKLKPHWDNSPIKCKKCNSLALNPIGQPMNTKPFSPGACQSCGTEQDPMGPLDGHIPSKKSKQDVLEELISASERSNRMEPGSVPSYVEATIDGLINPSVNLADHIRMACLREARNDGMRNDWKRPRRRALAMGQYMPRRKTFKPKWLAMLDTSASMQDVDIIYGISQLQSLGYETDGLVIPCDASVHWDSATEIKELSDLAQTTVVGRGGTIFDNFFKNFPDKVGTDFDVVVIITDGLVGFIPSNLAPPIDCLWVITRADSRFIPPFGRVIPLR